jgi:hypothetical protein
MKVENNFTNFMENKEFINIIENLETPAVSNPSHQRKLRVALMNSKIFHKASFMKSFLKILAPVVGIAIIAALIVFIPKSVNTANAQKSLDEAIQKLQNLPAAASSTIPSLTNAEAITMLEEAKQGIDLHFATEFDAATNAEFNKYNGKITVLQYENKEGKTVQIFLTEDKLPIKKLVFGDTQVGVPATITINEDTTTTKNWKTFTDVQNGFIYKYPADFEMKSKLTFEQKQTIGSYIPICNDPSDYDNLANYHTIACTYYIGALYKNTNFEAAGLSVNKQTDLVKNECLKTEFNNGQPTAPVVINGTTFYFDYGGGVGMGHGSSDEIYRTFHNNSCYVITLRVVSNNSNTNMDIRPQVGEFKGTDTLFTSMRTILSTFTFTVIDNPTADNTPPAPVTIKTFANNDLGITFQYPSNRQVIFSRPDGFGVGEIKKSPTQGDEIRYAISFMKDSRSLEEIQATYAKIMKSDIKTTITLGGETAMLYTPTSDIVHNATIYIRHNNQVYQISIDRTDTDIYKSFLTTFQFTK